MNASEFRKSQGISSFLNNGTKGTLFLCLLLSMDYKKLTETRMLVGFAGVKCQSGCFYCFLQQIWLNY